MKKYILNSVLAITFSLFVTSCSSTYFYTTLNSTSPELEKVDNGDFLFQNDSLWIAHCFKGEDAPIQITVFNKLDVPLYVDWNRSSLILNDVAYTYNTGKASSNTYVERGYDYVHETTVNSTQFPKHVTFVPPKTMVTHHPLRIAAQFDEISKKNYEKGKLGTKDGQTVNIKRINYDYDSSPLHFTSYITVYYEPDKLQSYELDFHVTNLIRTNVKPDNLPADMADRGDFFYQQKRPNNTGWYILADVALVTGAVALDVLLYGDDYNY